MALIKLENYCLHYGEQIIFDHLDMQIEKGQRLCLIGRNGVGKSTLLACLQGLREVDSGERWLRDGSRIASLAQDLPDADTQSVYHFVAAGLGSLGEKLEAYERISHEANPNLDRLAQLQQEIESADGWRLNARIQTVLSRLTLNAESRMGDLSGGWRRRAALAQALVCEPDVLLLDEPTNHLDLAAIRWLEEFLQQYQGALVFITHDRAFLRRVANGIAELDRGKLRCWQGSYDGFLKFREQQLAAEEKQNAEFDKKLAQEETWIRQGIKARRTRNEGRVRALKAMREERRQRLQGPGQVKLLIEEDDKSGKLVCELENICFSYGNKPLIQHFSTRIVRGDRIGLLGPNGIGKTSLLKIILGELAPQSGNVKRGTNLSVAYFDQVRAQLDLNQSARDNIAGGQDFIEIDGKRKHVMSYLQDFLFSGERAHTAIKTLSGGERNRILLAKLFCQPSNVLVLDEPTNDLDLETLELLEEILMNYQGTLLLVSHDREFMNNVVTSTIAFEGKGEVKEYVGAFDDWLRQGGRWPDDSLATEKTSVPSGSEPTAVASEPQIPKHAHNSPKPRKKLSYKEQLEYDTLPEKIENLEENIAAIQAQMSASGFYQKPLDDQKKVQAEFESLNIELQAAYERWQRLDEKIA